MIDTEQYVQVKIIDEYNIHYCIAVTYYFLLFRRRDHATRKLIIIDIKTEIKRLFLYVFS